MIWLPGTRTPATWEAPWSSAKEPSRELDLEIAKAFGKATDDYRVSNFSVTGIISGDGVGGYGNPFVERYSSDVTAIIALVEAALPEAMWDLHRASYGYVASVRALGHCEAQLPAVALAIALRLELEREP